MKTHTLEINVNNIRNYIKQDYMVARDLFYRVLIFELIFNCKDNYSAFMEEEKYNNLLLNIKTSTSDCNSVLSYLFSTQELLVYTDLSIYIGSFLQDKHRHNRYNLYSLTITDNYHLRIYNRTLGSFNRNLIPGEINDFV